MYHGLKRKKELGIGKTEADVAVTLAPTEMLIPIGRLKETRTQL
jgi:hypothetical protein